MQLSISLVAGRGIDHAKTGCVFEFVAELRAAVVLVLNETIQEIEHLIIEGSAWVTVEFLKTGGHSKWEPSSRWNPSVDERVRGTPPWASLWFGVSSVAKSSCDACRTSSSEIWIGIRGLS